MQTIVEIQLTQLVVDVAFQPRIGGIDADHVRALQQAPESWPPVLTVEIDGRLCLVDGFHRLAAAQNLGLETVPVEVISLPQNGDIRGLAFDLNAKHGRPLSLDDRRAEANRLLTANAEVSNMEVSRRVGLSPTTIAAIRERLEAGQAIDAVDRRIGRDGTAYSVGASRQSGELPAPTFGETLTSTLGRIFTPAERIQQRTIARYLERLAVSLEDLDDLDGWDTADDAAEACRLVLGTEKATSLSKRLGWSSRAVLDVALVLGYDDSEAGQ